VHASYFALSPFFTPSSCDVFFFGLNIFWHELSVQCVKQGNKNQPRRLNHFLAHGGVEGLGLAASATGPCVLNGELSVGLAERAWAAAQSNAAGAGLAEDVLGVDLHADAASQNVPGTQKGEAAVQAVSSVWLTIKSAALATNLARMAADDVEATGGVGHATQQR